MNLLIIWLIVATVHAVSSDYNGNCVACVNNNYYYCTRDDNCREVYVDGNSCEKGVFTCLAYEAVDMGVQEVAPYNQTHRYFNQSVTAGKGVKFGVSNQDSKEKAWVEIQLSLLDNSTVVLDEQPASFVAYYYNQTNANDSMTEYIFSKSGKVNMKPQSTSFFWVGTSNQSFTMHVKYGNYMVAM